MNQYTLVYMTAPSDFLNQSDPKRIAVETRNVRMGAVRRENEQPGASGIALSLPEMFNAPQPPTIAEPVAQEPTQPTPGAGGLSVPSPGAGGLSVPSPGAGLNVEPETPSPDDGLNVEPETPVVEPAVEPLTLPDFTQPLPFTPMTAQPGMTADKLFEQQQLGRGAENLVRFAGAINSFQVPSPFRSYAAPPTEPDISGAVRQAQFYNEYIDRLNAEIAATALVPRGSLGTRTEDVLRQLPLLDPTRSVLNQTPGGLVGQVGEPQYDQRWLSGSWLRAFGRVAQNVGNQLIRGDYLAYLNPVNIARGIGRYAAERQRAARPVEDAMRSLATGGRTQFTPSESLSRRIAALSGAVLDESFRAMSPQSQARTRETSRSFNELFQESLQGFLPQELADGSYRIDPLRGYFGEMGAGIPGAALYGLSLIGNIPSIAAYTVGDTIIETADAVTGGRATETVNRLIREVTVPSWLLTPGTQQSDLVRPQIVNAPGYNPFFRVQQALSGVDLGITNPMGLNGNRYLATGLSEGFRGEVRALSYLTGFGIDVVSGGWADNLATSVVGAARRRAIATSRQGIAGLNPLPNSQGSRTTRALQRLFEQQRAARARRGIVSFANNTETPLPGVVSPAAPAPPTPGGTVNYTTLTNNLNNSPVSPRNQIITQRTRSQQALVAELTPPQPQRALLPAATPTIVPDVSPEAARMTNEAFASAVQGFVNVETPSGILVRIPTDTAPRTSTTAIVPYNANLETRIERYVDDLIDLGEATIVTDNVVVLPNGRARRRITGSVPEQPRLPGTTPEQPQLPGSNPAQRQLPGSPPPQRATEPSQPQLPGSSALSQPRLTEATEPPVRTPINIRETPASTEPLDLMPTRLNLPRAPRVDGEFTAIRRPEDAYLLPPAREGTPPGMVSRGQRRANARAAVRNNERISALDAFYAYNVGIDDTVATFDGRPYVRDPNTLEWVPGTQPVENAPTTAFEEQRIAELFQRADEIENTPEGIAAFDREYNEALNGLDGTRAQEILNVRVQQRADNRQTITPAMAQSVFDVPDDATRVNFGGVPYVRNRETGAWQAAVDISAEPGTLVRTVETVAAAQDDIIAGSPTATLLAAQDDVRPAIVETATSTNVVREEAGGILIDALQRRERILTHVRTQRNGIEHALRGIRNPSTTPARRAQLIEDVKEGLRRATRVLDDPPQIADDVIEETDEIRELEEFITNQRVALNELLRQTERTTDRAKRTELARKRQAIRSRIEDAQEQLKDLRTGNVVRTLDEIEESIGALPVPSGLDRATINAASPVIPARALAPSMTPEEYIRFLDSEEYYARIGALRSDDITPVRRTGEELTRLAKYLTDETGRPIVNPARRSPLNKRELEKLRARYPGVFEQYGREIPDEILHPQARVEITEPRLNEPPSTQFLAPRDVPLSPREATSPTDLTPEMAQAELFEEQLSLDALRKMDARREELLTQLWQSDDVPEDIIQELAEMETARLSFPSDPNHPAIARSVNDRLIPTSYAVGDLNDLPTLQRYLEEVDAMDEVGNGLRQLSDGIRSITDELEETANTLDMEPFLKRGQTSDELANGVNIRAGGETDNPLPRHVENLVNGATFRETTPIDMAAREAVQNALDSDVPLIPPDEMAQRVVRDVETWYHGTKQGEEAFFSNEFDPRQGSSAEFGSGLYVTDRADVAEMYARAALDPSYRYPGTTRFDVPKVVQFPGTARPRNPLYLGQRLSEMPLVSRNTIEAAFRNAASDVLDADDVFNEALRELNRKHPFLRDRWLNYREAYARTFNAPISESLYQEFSNNVAGALKRAGYDSLIDTHAVRGKTLVILPGDNFWHESPLPPNSPTVPLRTSGDPDADALEAAMARHQADALLNRAMERQSTGVWEHQSRMQLLEELLQRYTREYDELVEEGLGASDNALALQRQLREMRKDYDIRRMRELEQSGNAQQTRRATSIDTDKPNPCI